jgi:hypothetical protein
VNGADDKVTAKVDIDGDGGGGCRLVNGVMKLNEVACADLASRFYNDPYE